MTNMNEERKLAVMLISMLLLSVENKLSVVPTNHHRMKLFGAVGLL